MSTWRTRASLAAFKPPLRHGRVGLKRVLFLRTASNYCMQGPSQDVNTASIRSSGLYPSLEAGVPGRKPRGHELAAMGTRFADRAAP